MRVLVVGGTLFIGKHLVGALRQASHEVTVLHRNPWSGLPEGVRSVVADRNDPVAVASALAGQRFDAVFDNVYDWQRGTTADQVVATARLCETGLSRYVFMSSVAAYGAGIDHIEEDPLATDDHPEIYCRNKAQSERALFAMKDFPVVTLRPPFVYGPGNPFYREAFFWDRARDGRTIIVPEGGKRLMQFVYVKDIVRCCLKILDTPEAVGKAFNIGDLKPLTQLEVVRAMAPGLPLVHIPRERIFAAGGDPMGPKLYFGTYYDLPPITMKIGRAQRVLDFQPTPFDVGLRESLAAWLEDNPFPAPDYSFEDALLGAG